MTTPPAKAGGFLQSRPLQQRLLRLRMHFCTTLVPDGSIQADWALVIRAFQVLRSGLPAAALELEVVKEQRTAPMRAKVEISIPPKGGKRNSAVA